MNSYCVDVLPRHGIPSTEKLHLRLVLQSEIKSPVHVSYTGEDLTQYRYVFRDIKEAKRLADRLRRRLPEATVKVVPDCGV